jgi:hypothetical protein
MSTSPMLPSSVSSENQWKQFWSRPEGKMGAALLVLLVGLGIFAWGTVSAFLVAMLVDTVHMAMLAGLLFAMGWVVFSKRSHMLFRLLSRYLTGLIINIDPIGILEDHLQQMKKRREQLGDQITNVAGQKRYLENIIEQNKKDATQNLAYAAQAQKMAQTTDAQKKLQMELQVRAKANKAGRLQQSNVGYQQLLVKITTVYDLLSKWAINIDFFIEDTEDTVKQAKIQYKVTSGAFNAIKTGMAIIRGNADENDLYDRTMEHLAEDAGAKLGAIEDFQRVAQNFMDSMDIANGAIDTQALEQLNQYEQKLLTSGSQDTAFLLPGATKEAVPVQAQAVGQGTKKTGYEDLLK